MDLIESKVSLYNPAKNKQSCCYFLSNWQPTKTWDSVPRTEMLQSNATWQCCFTGSDLLIVLYSTHQYFALVYTIRAVITKQKADLRQSKLVHDHKAAKHTWNHISLNSNNLWWARFRQIYVTLRSNKCLNHFVINFSLQ